MSDGYLFLTVWLIAIAMTMPLVALSLVVILTVIQVTNSLKADKDDTP